MQLLVQKLKKITIVSAKIVQFLVKNVQLFVEVKIDLDKKMSHNQFLNLVLLV